MKKIFVILAIPAMFLIAIPALAQDCEIFCPPDTICIPNPLKYCMLDDFLYGITNFIFWIANALAPIMIIIGAFYFVTSAGSPQRVATGKRIITYTLIGYAMILMSKGLVAVIKNILGVTT